MLDKDTALRVAKIAKIFNEKLNFLCERYHDFAEGSHKNFNALMIVEVSGMVSGMQMQNPDMPAGFWHGLMDDNEELTNLCIMEWFENAHDNYEVLLEIECEAKSYISDKLDYADKMMKRGK